MAQHDMNIANQGFPAFRSDLNNALSAIQTNHSGTSRPTGAVAGQMWLDTTNATSPTLKFFDGTDDISFATIDYAANTVNFLDSTISFDIVNDVTPQLGGDLDVNGNDFVSTSNGDINFTPNGTGKIVFNGGSKIQHIAEKATVSATAATGTINYDVTTQAVLYYTTNASGNWTLNIRGDGSNSLNSIMDTGEAITVVHLVTQGGTAYYNSAVQIDGSSVTPEWQGGSAPSEGNTSSIDAYTYTIFKTADATFTVLASQTQFA